VDGLHVNTTYTAIAHFWLLKNLLNVKEWNFVTDNDPSLTTAIYRVFRQDILDGYAHHYLCITDETKKREQAYTEFLSWFPNLQSWAALKGIHVK